MNETDGTKGFHVLIWHHGGYNKLFVSGAAASEALTQAHAAAQDTIANGGFGLMAGEYYISATPATRYKMAPTPRRRVRKQA